MIKNSEKGVSLIITFFILVIVLAVVLSISVILYSELKIIRNIGDSVVAFYAADSGVEKTLYYGRKVLPENMAGSKRGICNMCDLDNPNKCPDCNDCLAVPLAVNGCDVLTCENCEVTFNSDLSGGKKYKVTAKVSRIASQDDPPVKFSELNINSVGSYNSVFGADPIKRAIEINVKKDYSQPPPPVLSVLVTSLPNNTFIGQEVTFFAVPSPEIGDYTYSWEISPSSSCSNGNTNQICEATFASEGIYTATVTVIDAGIPEPQTVLGSASVTIYPEIISTKIAFTISPATTGQGGYVTLTATLTDFTTSEGISEKLITFYNGATSMTTGWTNSSGIALAACDSATCTATVGSYILQAKFSGDSFYSASESPKQTLAVTEPWSVCGDNLIDTRDGKTYGTVLIGNKCWMRQNLNVGIKITSCTNGYVGVCSAGGDTVKNQGIACALSDGSDIQKYCFGDKDSNCSTYGGLYQWRQAMCNSTANGAMGICPAGWHIPTNNEWMDLERAVCPASPSVCVARFPYNSNNTGWFGSNEGSRLKTLASYSFSALLAGWRKNDGSFNNLGLPEGYTSFWSSLETGFSFAWYRGLSATSSQVYHSPIEKTYGYSVRCIKN